MHQTHSYLNTHWHTPTKLWKSHKQGGGAHTFYTSPIFPLLTLFCVCVCAALTFLQRCPVFTGCQHSLCPRPSVSATSQSSNQSSTVPLTHTRIHTYTHTQCFSDRTRLMQLLYRPTAPHSTAASFHLLLTVDTVDVELPLCAVGIYCVSGYVL